MAKGTWIEIAENCVDVENFSTFYDLIKLLVSQDEKVLKFQVHSRTVLILKSCLQINTHLMLNTFNSMATCNYILDRIYEQSFVEFLWQFLSGLHEQFYSYISEVPFSSSQNLFKIFSL